MNINNKHETNHLDSIIQMYGMLTYMDTIQNSTCIHVEIIYHTNHSCVEIIYLPLKKIPPKKNGWGFHNIFTPRPPCRRAPENPKPVDSKKRQVKMFSSKPGGLGTPWPIRTWSSSWWLKPTPFKRKYESKWESSVKNRGVNMKNIFETSTQSWHIQH